MSTISERIRARLVSIRFGQFASVGVVGAICDNLVLALGLSFEMTPELAKIAGAETAIIVMFWINEHWTFGEEGKEGIRPLIRRLLTSNVVRLGGVLVATVIFSVVYRQIDVRISLVDWDVWFLVANGCGIIAGLVVNYILESTVTWRAGDAYE
ncbi:GtrA family protein [Halocatena marina]|nr:GtrA family protein [Halocatena marina]